MKCEYCAEQIADDSEECPSCGEPLFDDEPAPAKSSATVIVVVVAVAFACIFGIGLLAALLIPALRRAKGKAQIAVTRSHMHAIKAALAYYEADMGSYPRLLPRTSGEGLLQDDAVALQAALLEPSSQGGGPNSPYLIAWPAKSLSQTRPTLLLDSWGNPYHYREWASVPSADKDGLSTAWTVGSGVIIDLPHSPESFDIWSNGPNGVNEYGAEGSDDVVSWR